MDGIFVLKLISYFLLWTLYSYTIHYIAHQDFKYNFLRVCHLKHHEYRYENLKWPPFHDFFFWFGNWKGTLDVWITFTLPLIALLFIEFEVALCLLAFHYVYEVFLSRDILDHNPNIKGRITNFIPIGVYHMKHHRNFRQNYAFFVTLWDMLFGTNDAAMKAKIEKTKKRRDMKLGEVAGE